MLGSCTSVQTYQEQYVEAGKHLSQRDFNSAAEVIEEYKDISYLEKDRVLYYLDVGMLYHYAGEYEKSNEALSAAEQGIEELYTESISKMISSGVLNDNALAYSGEDYEDLYLNVFKCLNYIGLNKIDEAMVEVRRAQIKLNLLEDKYRKIVEDYNSSAESEGVLPIVESRFHNDVLTRYLSYLLYRLENSTDDMRIENKKLLQAFNDQPSIYGFAPPVFAKGGKDRAVLTVLSFTGQSPVKTAKTLYLTTIDNAVIINTSETDSDNIEELTGFNIIPIPGLDAGNHFKFQYPVFEDLGSRVDRIILKLGDESYDVPIIEDIQGISHEMFKQKQPVVLGRTVLRIVLKEVSKQLGKNAVNDAVNNEMLGFLFGLMMDIAVDLTENADLRISRYFPAFAHSLDLGVAPGTYPLSIDYYENGRLLFSDDRGRVDIKPGKFNLFESFYLE